MKVFFLQKIKLRFISVCAAQVRLTSTETSEKDTGFLEEEVKSV